MAVQNHDSRQSYMSLKAIRSNELFGSFHEIIILHEGAEYRLRITSNGKLILTK